MRERGAWRTGRVQEHGEQGGCGTTGAMFLGLPAACTDGAALLGLPASRDPAFLGEPPGTGVAVLGLLSGAWSNVNMKRSCVGCVPGLHAEMLDMAAVVDCGRFFVGIDGE